MLKVYFLKSNLEKKLSAAGLSPMGGHSSTLTSPRRPLGTGVRSDVAQSRTSSVGHTHIHDGQPPAPWANGHWTGLTGWVWRGRATPPSHKTKQSALPQREVGDPRTARSLHTQLQSGAGGKLTTPNSHKLKVRPKCSAATITANEGDKVQKNIWMMRVLLLCREKE